MKSDAVLIAHELILACLQKTDPKDHAIVLDSAIHAALSKGIPLCDIQSSLASFVKEMDNTIDVSIVVSDHTWQGEHLATIVKNAMKCDIHSSVHQNKDLLGGAIVSVSDDRFDFSLRTALSRAASVLKGASPQEQRPALP